MKVNLKGRSLVDIMLMMDEEGDWDNIVELDRVDWPEKLANESDVLHVLQCTSEGLVDGLGNITYVEVRA